RWPPWPDDVDGPLASSRSYPARADSGSGPAVVLRSTSGATRATGPFGGPRDAISCSESTAARCISTKRTWSSTSRRSISLRVREGDVYATDLSANGPFEVDDNARHYGATAATTM